MKHKHPTLVTITDGKIDEEFFEPLSQLVEFEFDYKLQCLGYGEELPKPKTIKELVKILNGKWATPYNRFEVGRTAKKYVKSLQ